ncbi:SDR family NAD(P)-dependent oxidoreductase [Chromobacterium sp. CV08]|uniref:SDR family NAD(P)-dependent oxidoreductase n=1 Tax=Chromobacterium sp. CV08 TaxID=3133274 RepID=UPI003DA8092A
MIISDSLMVEPDSIGTEQTFVELGVDSILGVEIVKKINREFGLAFSSTVLYDYPSITLLAKHIDDGRLPADKPDAGEPAPAVETRKADPLEEARPVAPRPDALRQEAGDAGAPRLLADSRRALRELLAECLLVDVGSLDEKSSFLDMGVDSILGVELVRRLNRQFELKLSASVLYDYPCIDDLARHLAGLVRPQADAPRPPERRQQTRREDGAAPRPASRVEPKTGPAPAPARAEIKLRQTPAPVPAARPAADDIAIVGLSCRVPGARDAQAFWDLLSRGVGAVGEVPAERWRADAFFDADASASGKTYSKWGAFLDEVDQFDPLFFNISPTEAAWMDPQQRLFLESCWNALEHAGYTAADIGGSRTGVYAGVMNNDYHELILRSGEDLSEYGVTGIADSMMSSRISYFLNLKGPALTVNTACSSSLVAIHLACEALRSGQADMMLAGGVTCYLTESSYIGMSRLGMLSPSGVCAPFDDRADGIVPGEGVGVVILKRLADALADGSTIHGVIRGSSTNQDGKTNGITAPSVLSQTALLKELYEKTAIDPASVQCVEAHGTGTKLGDPIEVEALSAAFRSFTDKKRFCSLGSVKGNVGHTSAAAGVVGLIKILLCLKHRQLVPSLNYSKTNQHIDFENSPFCVQTELAEWAAPSGGVRRAALSSFGFSGTNAHLIVDEAPPPAQPAASARKPSYLVAVSARTQAALAERLADLKGHLDRSAEAPDLAALSFTLNRGREHFPWRCALVASSTADLAARIDEALAGRHGQQAMMGAGPSRTMDVAEELLFAEMAAIVSAQVGQGDVQDDAAYARKLAVLGALYVKGFDIDWASLHAGESAARIPLPTYPFQRRRCWMAQPAGRAADAAPVRVEPAAGARAFPTDGQIAAFAFSGRESFLADHRIAGQPILPAVMYLELARAALAGYGKAPSSFGGCVWIRPFAFPGGELRLRTEGLGRFEFVSERDGETVVHCRGLWTDEEGGARPVVSEMAALLVAAQEDVPSADIYPRFARRGIVYGPGFQTVRWIRRAGATLLAKLGETGSDGGAVLAPGLMDGALQALIGYEAGDDDATFLPFSMDEVHLYAPVSREAYAVIEPEAAEGRSGDAIRRFNIRICAEDGKVMLAIKRLAVRRYEPAGAGDDAPELLVCEMVREEEALPAGLPEAVAPGGLLVLGGQDGLDDAIRQGWFSGSGTPPVIAVGAGAAFEKDGPRQYRLDPSRPGDFSLLLDDLASSGIQPSHVLQLWSLRQRSGAGKGLSAVDGRLFEPLRATVALTQALLRAKLKAIRIVHAYDSEADASCFDAMVSGFAESLPREKPQYDLRVVGLAAGCRGTPELLAALRRQLFAEDAPRHVEYPGPDRVRRASLRRIAPKARAGGKVAPRQGGVYLITGGVGGLGYLFASWLATEFRARLILLGRRVRDDLIDTKLDALRAMGAGKVDYQCVDVGSGEQVEALVRKLDRDFGQLHGVIHSAGLVDDALVVNKSWAGIERVLAAKALGAQNLHQATLAHDLDFYALFSSLAAIKGNVGQADYAAGNAFLDHFAFWREGQRRQGKCHGHTVSINWPLWQDGGMRIDESGVARLREAFGIEPLGSQDGLAAFRAILASGCHQAAVVGGKSAAVARYLGVDAPSAAKAEPPARRPDAGRQQAEAAPAGRGGDVLETLADIFQTTLKLEAGDFDPDTEFHLLGLDSIQMMKILSVIEQRFDTVVPPSIIIDNPTLRSLTDALQSAGLIRATAASAPTPPALDAYGPPHGDGRREAPRAVPDPAPARDDRIAVIGMACRFPGAATLEAFWQNLREGRHVVGEIPAGRWDVDGSFSADKAAGKSYSKWGGFIDGVDLFDNAFFNISDEDALIIDPQQRIMLELTQELFDRSGYARADVDGGRIGVILGCSQSSYIERAEGLMSERQLAKAVVGTISNMVAARVADFYNLKGAAKTIDAACASSLIAIHDGCDALLNGSADMVVAGGIGLLLDDKQFVSFSRANVLSDDDVCSVFDKNAHGLVLGEGAGIVLLKRYERAVADGDRILGVILGSAVNNDGHTMGVTVPSQEAQQEVIEAALAKARVGADTVSYFEAHGTGTLLGDPIEIKAATRAYAKQSGDTGYCGVGSVKSNVGHLMRAAGVASFIKVMLSLQHRELVPTLHCEEPHPRFQFAASPFYPVDRTQDWQPRRGVRRAAISSFGFGGTNCHMVVEEAPPAVGPTRAPLAPTRFDRKRFWFGPDAAAIGSEERFLTEILQRIERGEIDAEEAVRLSSAEYSILDIEGGRQDR